MTEQAVAVPTPPPSGRDTGVVEPTMTDLQDHYVRRANEAVAEDRLDVVRELNEEYVEEALRLILVTA